MTEILNFSFQAAAAIFFSSLVTVKLLSLIVFSGVLGIENFCELDEPGFTLVLFCTQAKFSIELKPCLILHSFKDS